MSTQQLASRTIEATLTNDPEIQAVLLPSLCSCLRTELGLPDVGTEAEIVDRACDLVGIGHEVGTPIRRARACLVALGV